MKKKRTVIVTRDRSGYTDIWPSGAKPTKNVSGIWSAGRFGHIAGGECLINPIKAIFGFTPRKGSKRILNYTVDD